MTLLTTADNYSPSFLARAEHSRHRRATQGQTPRHRRDRAPSGRTASSPPQSHGQRRLLAIREALVERVRRDIASGCYETAAKLEAAIEALASRL
jgi:anti-sigma28 factor (negative regulator of flagellin synthesis)